jgi:vacuolar-type H+-ATPase subunit C/Vma6
MVRLLTVRKLLRKEIISKIISMEIRGKVTRTLTETGETVAHLDNRDLVSPLSPKGK